MDSSISLRFCDHYRAATKTVAQGVSSGRATASIGQWDKWLTFCDELGLDPFLEAFEDKVPILQVFIHRVRIGELAASGNQIKSRSVEDYLRAVAQTFLSLGTDDPRLNSAMKTDFRISRMLAAWKKEDPPANRVKPIPISVIRRIVFIAQRRIPASNRRHDHHCILLPPAPGRVHGRTIRGDRRLPLDTATDAELEQARTASLTFTTQKNGVQNEVIRHFLSGDPYI